MCHIVSTPAARLAAAAIVSVVRKTGHDDDATVAVAGSVFKKYPIFRADMKDAIEELCAGRKRLRLMQAGDRSGKGAALIAVIASQSSA